jgi:hypothetical protein
LSKEDIPWYTAWRIDIGKTHFDPATEFYVCWKPEVANDIIEKLTFLWFKRIYSEKF